MSESALAELRPPGGWVRRAPLCDNGCGRQVRTRGLCRRCPVVYACLAAQMAASYDGADYGVWGGTSAYERRAIRRELRERGTSGG